MKLNIGKIEDSAFLKPKTIQTEANGDGQFDILELSL
jgi:hypothetical protein